MKKVLSLSLAFCVLMSSLVLTTAAYSSGADSGSQYIECKNGIVLGLSGGVTMTSRESGVLYNEEGNFVPGVRFQVEVVEIKTDENGEQYAASLSKSAFNKSGADIYFKASKGGRYFRSASTRFTNNNSKTILRVQLANPYLNPKEADLQFKLGVKKGNASVYYEYGGAIDNIAYDKLGSDQTDVTINKAGARIKVDDAGFSDLIDIGFEAEEEVSFRVKMYNKDEVVLHLSTDVNKNILNIYNDVDIDFYSFSQLGAFNAAGTLRLPGNEGHYVYQATGTGRSGGGRSGGGSINLAPVQAAWDAEDEAFVILTRELGNYLVSNEQLDLSLLQADTEEDGALEADRAEDTQTSETGNTADLV